MTESEIRELAAWIDTRNIAESLNEALKSLDIEPTTENAQALWLNLCYSMDESLLTEAGVIVRRLEDGLPAAMEL